MDLFRVQGRWAAAARLAYVRCVLTNASDVCGGQVLSKSAPNTFPGADTWLAWERFFEEVWVQHKNNVISVSILGFQDYQYSIEKTAEDQFLAALDEAATAGLAPVGSHLWTPEKLRSFLRVTVRGFLRADLYTAMTEFLSRAEGSFGLQVHCAAEEGVVVLASKGQPMSLAFDPKRPICLFGSEAEAVAVPVYASGKWLPYRLDLNSRGEVLIFSAHS